MAALWMERSVQQWEKSSSEGPQYPLMQYRSVILGKDIAAQGTLDSSVAVIFSSLEEWTT